MTLKLLNLKSNNIYPRIYFIYLTTTYIGAFKNIFSNYHSSFLYFKGPEYWNFVSRKTTSLFLPLQFFYSCLYCSLPFHKLAVSRFLLTPCGFILFSIWPWSAISLIFHWAPNMSSPWSFSAFVLLFFDLCLISLVSVQLEKVFVNRYLINLHCLIFFCSQYCSVLLLIILHLVNLLYSPLVLPLILPLSPVFSPSAPSWTSELHAFFPSSSDTLLIFSYVTSWYHFLLTSL